VDDAVWTLTPPSAAAAGLAAAFGLPLPLGQVLVNRKIEDPETARRFLFGGLSDLHDPFLLAGMADAVERIFGAIGRGEKILIFGDYDVDGVLSVVVLHTALTALGARVDYFIPDRLRDGYGLKDAHVAVAAERGSSLVISVDCGIKASGFVRRAREAGIDVIITDHHQPGDEIPDALAVLNPALPGSSYPCRHLAGVGVAFKLVQALFGRAARPKDDLAPFLKLVAMGTIADVADLRGENRILVKHGLRDLETATDPGLRSLIEVSGLTGRRISEGDVGFRLGPRINAAGRMGRTDLAPRLFLSDSPEETASLARELDALNARRQTAEEKIFKQASERITSRGLAARYKILILGDETWPRGIIGIVASRLKESFLRPVVLLSYEGGMAYGSGRSIAGFSLIDCLESCRDVFLSHGGHPLAVGCSLARDRVPAFREAADRVAAERIPDDALRRKLGLDARLSFSEIDRALWDGLSLLDPYGVGNPRPVFLAEGAEIAAPPQRLQGRHAKFLVRQDGRTIEAIGWDRAAWAGGVAKGDRVDLAFTLQSSVYLGEERAYLGLGGLRRSR
jgi:single-stranded-DNA-specific exonuclease